MSQMVIKRTGEVVDFDGNRIRVAIAKAIRATAPPEQWESLENGTLSGVVSSVMAEIDTRFTELYPNVENIQDIVEKHLVKNGLYEIAKAYILYRAERQKAREQHKDQVARQSLLGKLTVLTRDGRTVAEDQVEGYEAVPMLANPGDVLFIHVMVLHTAGHNYTNRSRHKIINEYKTKQAIDNWGNRCAFAGLPLARNGKVLIPQI